MSKGSIAHNIDVVSATVDPVKQGVNPFENEGIMPNAKEPTGEKETNVQTPEKDNSKYPAATGSGY